MKNRAEEAWRAWKFTDVPPEDAYTRLLWDYLRKKLKEKAKGEEHE